jgi:hypothetical protein
MQLGSPSLDWRWWLDRGCRRRAAVTSRWWRGRGHSNSGEDRGGAGQCVARLASLGPSRCAEMVGWLGDRTEGGARRWQQWGGRREAYSGEQVEWLGLHMGVQDLWVRDEALGVLNWPRARAERGAHRWSTMATTAGLGCSREEGRRRPFMSGREAVGRSLCTRPWG